MPTCKKCGQDHHNFLKECPPAPSPVGLAGGRKWGREWGNAPRGVEVRYGQPFRQRTGSLTLPDGWDKPKET